MERLRRVLQQIDGQGYKSYKQLQGQYDFNRFQVTIDHVQGDPFALPSRISIQLSPEQHGIPLDLYHNRIRQTALEDYLARTTAAAINRYVRGNRGTGLSGTVRIAVNGQKILRRNAVICNKDIIEARILMALPAAGRRILGQEALAMFFEELPQIVKDGLVWCGKSLSDMTGHVRHAEDQECLRQQLDEHRAVAFLANGSVLPRRSGIDDRPLEDAVPFQSPEIFERSLKLPNHGTVSGMIIPAGITVIVGGGFHGKSTLLQALEHGVYNHIPGDGRELVATTASAVKIRAEDHRAIQEVDISPFIGTLPGDRQTSAFSTENASGSTSQAANIIEALECDCHCLLIDEDTSATNFMLRDRRMQQLVPAPQEPITPLLFRVRELYEKHRVSSIIVTGGSGDYLSVADQVLMLDHYRVSDVTDRAGKIAGPGPGDAPDAVPFFKGQKRHIDFTTAPFPRQNRIKIQVREQRLLEYGRRRIDLSLVEQLVDTGQTEAIGYLLKWCQDKDPAQHDGVIETLRKALSTVEQDGLDILLPWKAGHLAMPRLSELAAAANRLRPKAVDE